MSRDLLLLAMALFSWGVGEGMFFNFQPLYLMELGADPLLVGSILGVAGFAMMLAHIPAGYLSDRIGRRPLLWTAWTSGLIAAWIMALARSLPVFVAGLLLYSLTAFVTSPLDSYITAARGKWTVGRALTLVSATFNAGFMIGPVMGGWLADRFSLRIIYFIAAGLFILSTAVVLLLREQPRDAHDPDAPPQGLLANTRYRAFLGLAFVVVFAMYLPQPLSPVFLQGERGLSFGQIGILGSLGGLGNVLLNLLLGQLDARLGFLIGQLCVAFFSLLIVRGTGMPAYGLGYFLLGGYRATRSLINAQVQPLVHASRLGLAYGLVYTVTGIALAVTPPVAGFLYQQDPGSMYPVATALIALALLVSLLFLAWLKRSHSLETA